MCGSNLFQNAQYQNAFTISLQSKIIRLTIVLGPASVIPMPIDPNFITLTEQLNSSAPQHKFTVQPQVTTTPIDSIDITKDISILTAKLKVILPKTEVSIKDNSEG